MPTNQLAPPDMPWLTAPVGRPNILGPPLLNYAAPPAPDAPGAAVAQTYQDVSDYISRQRAESVRQGLLDPDTGLPTQKGLVDAARATAEGVMMGTTAPGSVKLSMDAASRLARARQQGFDVGTTWYHGTGGEHPELDLAQAGRISSGDAPGLWFTGDIGYANEYAQNAGHIMMGEPRIIQTHIRADNPLTVNFPDAPHDPTIDGKPVVNGKVMDFENNSDIVAYAKRNGHDVVFMPDGNFSEATAAAAVLKHGRVRSTDAAFDPDKADSNNLAH